MANDEKGARGSGKPSPIKLLRRPLLEQGMARTLNAIEGVVDPELESGRQLLLGDLDTNDSPAIGTSNQKATGENVDSSSPVVEKPEGPSANPKSKRDKNKQASKAPEPVSSSGEYIYNLKVQLLPEEAEKLEALCLSIRFEIRKNSRRKQLIGLQTLAQALFNKMLQSEKFRTEVKNEMINTLVHEGND